MLFRSLNDIYQCPPQMEIGTRVFRNYESIGFGAITTGFGFVVTTTFGVPFFASITTRPVDGSV